LYAVDKFPEESITCQLYPSCCHALYVLLPLVDIFPKEYPENAHVFWNTNEPEELYLCIFAAPDKFNPRITPPDESPVFVRVENAELLFVYLLASSNES
jgi:hypothetical protein